MTASAVARCGVLLSLFAAVSTAGAADTTTVYLPALHTERPGLGFSTSAVVGAQVWQTLRKQSADSPGVTFGEGLVMWSPDALDVSSHESAEQRGRSGNVMAQLVLWGAAYEYGDDVVAQFSLSLPAYDDFRSQRPELWTVRAAANAAALSVVADPPSRRYSFEPIVLSKEVVAAFSAPTGLPLFSTPSGAGTVVGRLGREFAALEARPEAVLVQSADAKGWLRLPNISRNRSEVVDFVSAMVRVYRADWRGARDYFSRVIDNPAAPSALLTDAYLLRAMVSAQYGEKASEILFNLEKARALSPHARRVAIYEAMARIQAAAAEEPCKRVESSNAISQLLDARKYVFPANDPWLLQWQGVNAAWRAACERR
jgi:hypothetical protein